MKCVVSAAALAVGLWPGGVLARDIPTEEEVTRELGLSAVADTVQNYVKLSLSGLFAAGYTTAGKEAAAALQGGAHDPRGRGFTVQNVELSLMGAVDPYFSAEAHLIFALDAEGESTFELEEAFAASQALPWGLQLKAGTFFLEFGRLNPQHPHRWAFVDQPVVNTRFLGGDGLRNPGGRVSWLTPLPWYSEILAGVHSAHGETAASFIGAPDRDELAGFELIDNPTDNPLWNARWLNSVDLTADMALNLGLSGALGPNRTSRAALTYLAGVDVFYKWQPTDAYKGFPFVSVQSEVMWRRHEIVDSSAALQDFGLYGQVAWGLTAGWVTALRYDYADGDASVLGELEFDRRHRASANVTYYPSEFSKVRLQYNYDDSPSLVRGRAHAVWLQFEFLLGSHAAHTF